MRHTFISYSRSDNEIVNQIVARLMGDGFEVWLDRKDIRGGDLWREEIVEAVDRAYAFVLMLSPNSAASDNVRKEVDLAEGSNIPLIPLLLSLIVVPARLRYQLAGIQWLEYYSNPEAKYSELVEVLRDYRQKAGDGVTDRREAELVIKIDLSKFGVNEQERLLNSIAAITGTARTDIKLTTVKAGSMHAFVDMPAPAAYRLKTAALNQDLRLLQLGIEALRLSGDRKYVFIKTGKIAPLPRRRSVGRWFLGGLGLLIALLLSSLLIPGVRAQLGLFATATPTPTTRNTVTPTPTNTFTATPSDTPTALPSLTATPTEMFTPTATTTLTSTYPPPPPSSPRPILPRANDVYSSFANCQNVTFAWRPTSQEAVTYALHVQATGGVDVASPSGIRGTSTILKLCSGGYLWQVNATRISDGQTGPWSKWIPFTVRQIPSIKIPIQSPIPIPK